MVIEIDFQSDEALYTQLMNQIIMGICHIPAAGKEILFHLSDSLRILIGINMHTVNKAYSVTPEGFVSIDRRKGAVICSGCG